MGLPKEGVFQGRPDAVGPEATPGRKNIPKHRNNYGGILVLVKDTVIYK